MCKLLIVLFCMLVFGYLCDTLSTTEKPEPTEPEVAEHECYVCLGCNTKDVYENKITKCVPEECYVATMQNARGETYIQRGCGECPLQNQKSYKCSDCEEPLCNSVRAFIPELTPVTLVSTTITLIATY